MQDKHFNEGKIVFQALIHLKSCNSFL